MRLLLFALVALISSSRAPAAPWSAADAQALLDYARHLDSHGLDPADYELAALQQALAGQDEEALDRAATASFALIARDLANGRTPASDRRLSYFRGMGLRPEAVPALIDRATASHAVAATLEGLAPSGSEYRMLRAALVSLPDGARKERAAVITNLERWRWLPRDLGEHYLIVNIPEFVVREIDHGNVIGQHRVIVGKRSTPTPQFSATVNGVIFNPNWRVPQSIIAESVGALVRNRPAEAQKRGYSWTSDGGALQVTQAPGPTNSLGQVKLDMPNPLSIYLHDTPSKALFDQKVRTFSHGCIRTDKPSELAARLLAGTGWTPERIAATIEGRETVAVPLLRPIPVYIVYLTAQAAADGTLTLFDDPYKLDAAIAGRLAARALSPVTLAYSECALAAAG